MQVYKRICHAHTEGAGIYNDSEAYAAAVCVQIGAFWSKKKKKSTHDPKIQQVEGVVLLHWPFMSQPMRVLLPVEQLRLGELNRKLLSCAFQSEG